MKNCQVVYSKVIPLFLLFAGTVCSASAQQVNVVSAEVNSYNVSPRGLCQVTIMNTAPSVQVIMQAQLLDAANEPLVTIRTNPFTLHNGLNVSANMNFSISSVIYGNTSLVAYIRNSNVLPTGHYNYCVQLMTLGAVESGDPYCEEIESDLNTFLYLVNPEDKDTLYTPTPVLIWNHSDPFNTLGPGEYYRMIVTPLLEGQSADEAIAVNTPIYFKNNLHESQVQYPFDATVLEPGKHYAWQVQLMSNNVVSNKSEAWEFVEAIQTPLVDNKYAVVKQTLDGGFYIAVNNKVFFCFDEPYATTDIIESHIYDSKMQEVKSKIYDASKKSIAVLHNGYNQYEVDLNGLNVSSGFYVLQIKNGKGEIFLLKFKVN